MLIAYNDEAHECTLREDVEQNHWGCHQAQTHRECGENDARNRKDHIG